MTGKGGRSRWGPRLAAIAGLVPSGSRVADVGTGHAGLADMLLASGRAAHCIATEISLETLESIREKVRGRALPGGFELRGGDGLEALSPADRIDVLVIAGIGARKIIGILASSRLDALGVRRLVLQPQSEPELLDRWLTLRGFRVVDERRPADRGRSYRVLAAERG